MIHKSSISVLEAHDEMLAAKRDVHHSNHKVVRDKFEEMCGHVAIAHENGTGFLLSI